MGSPMKMIKAMKKLKLWSRKKKKRKSLEPYYPPSAHHCCCSCSSTQPSAPPLPPWFEDQQSQEAILAPGVQSFPDSAYQSQAQLPTQEVTVETSLRSIFPVNDISTQSYQQYMDPNPVYGMPVVQVARRSERSARSFGCVLDFGITLIRCFCPCFHIREAV